MHEQHIDRLWAIHYKVYFSIGTAMNGSAPPQSNSPLAFRDLLSPQLWVVYLLSHTEMSKRGFVACCLHAPDLRPWSLRSSFRDALSDSALQRSEK